MVNERDCSGAEPDTRNRAQRRARQGRNARDGRDEAIAEGRKSMKGRRGSNPANRNRDSRHGR